MFIKAENKYGAYYIPESSKHRFCARRVLDGHVWEQDTIDCIIENSNNKSVVHCGTYFGDMLPALCAETKFVYAFEPSKINFAATQKTVEANNLQNLELTNAALSNEKGSLGFSDDMGGASQVQNHKNPFTTVNSIRLDDIVTQSVAVIHLDVEGWELHALQGAFRTIKNNLPTIIIERPVKHEWWAELEDLGYKLTGRCDVNYIWQT